MRLMRGQPHERSPLVSVLSDNRRPCSRINRWVRTRRASHDFNRRTANRFDAAYSTTTCPACATPHKSFAPKRFHP